MSTRICLRTDKGYWTGFTFVDSWKNDKCKYYSTKSGARRAANILTKRHRIEFYVTMIFYKPTKCPICNSTWKPCNCTWKPQIL